MRQKRDVLPFLASFGAILSRIPEMLSTVVDLEVLKSWSYVVEIISVGDLEANFSADPPTWHSRDREKFASSNLNSIPELITIHRTFDICGTVSHHGQKEKAIEVSLPRPSSISQTSKVHLQQSNQNAHSIAPHSSKAESQSSHRWR